MPSLNQQKIVTMLKNQPNQLMLGFFNRVMQHFYQWRDVILYLADIENTVKAHQYLKRKILSSINHHHVLSNLYVLLFSVENKKRYLQQNESISQHLQHLCLWRYDRSINGWLEFYSLCLLISFKFSYHICHQLWMYVIQTEFWIKCIEGQHVSRKVVTLQP